MEIDDLAARIAALGDELSGASGALSRTDPGPAAFGGAAPGRLGELGRALHARTAGALAARDREAAAAGARLADLAGSLRTAAAGYRDVEDAARRRHQGTGVG